MSQTATTVRYQLRRPDGNLIYSTLVAGNEDVGFGAPYDNGSWLLHPGHWVHPPWQLWRREGLADWELLLAADPPDTPLAGAPPAGDTTAT